MNTISFPSPSQSLFTSSIKLPFSSPHNTCFKFNNTPNHVNIPHLISTTCKATATAVAAPEKETLYDLLGITEDVSLPDIKRAYKRMALKYHPDVSPPDRAEEYTMRFIRVQEAYQTLSDPEARSMYDGRIARGFVFSGKRDRHSSSNDRRRWKGQISELQRRRNTAARGMSWATRVRMQRGGNGSDPNQ